MSQSSNTYFNNIDAGVPETVRQQWEYEITVAESSRLKNPMAMDIMGVRDIRAEVETPPTIVVEATETEEWIQLALNLEKKQ